MPEGIKIKSQNDIHGSKQVMLIPKGTRANFSAAPEPRDLIPLPSSSLSPPMTSLSHQRRVKPQWEGRMDSSHGPGIWHLCFSLNTEIKVMSQGDWTAQQPPPQVPRTGDPRWESRQGLSGGHWSNRAMPTARSPSWAALNLGKCKEHCPGSSLPSWSGPQHS